MAGIVGVTDGRRETLEDVISDCKRLFDAVLSEEDMAKLNERLEGLAREDANYRRSLADLKSNSCSEVSRSMATEMERGERITENFTRELFSDILSGDEVSDDKMNVAALYVEYLADHAEHETRQALLAAYRLKQQKETQGHLPRKREK